MLQLMCRHAVFVTKDMQQSTVRKVGAVSTAVTVYTTARSFFDRERYAYCCERTYSYIHGLSLAPAFWYTYSMTC